jgi:hypothetical protein
MLPIDLREGGYLFSTKAPNTISHGLWATDEVGVAWAADSVRSHSKRKITGSRSLNSACVLVMNLHSFQLADRNLGVNFRALHVTDQIPIVLCPELTS